MHKLISTQITASKSNIRLHGLLLWASMGFLMPIGILTIRISNRYQRSETRFRVLFYLHVVFQVLSVLMATAGAVMSIRTLDNSFNNDHQRLGLGLYAAFWIQFLIGIVKPLRGIKTRKTWYFMHWIVGTTVSLVGIINIYTGLMAYQEKTSKSTRLWTILFTIEVSLIGFLYLFQERWEYMRRQHNGDLHSPSGDHEGGGLGHNTNNSSSAHNNQAPQVVAATPIRGDQKLQLVPQPCDKTNALMNLFD